MSKLWLLSTSLVFLAWLINENIPVRRPPLVNWDSTIYFSPYSDGLWLLPNASLGIPEPGVHYPSNILLPKSKEEIAHMIKSALVPPPSDTSSKLASIPRSRRIRVLGSGHSWSYVAQSHGLQLSLEKYKGVVNINRELKQVTVLGGTTFKELNLILEKNGLALSNLGSISEQTVAGAISTGTHGTGVEFGNLATMVTRLELITGEGEILSLSANENPNIFKAAQISVGLLGVISEVTLQCEPAFNLREKSSIVTMEHCLERMESIAHGSQHVKMWVELYTSTCCLFETDRTDESPRDNPNHVLETAKNYGFELITNLASWLPKYAPQIITTLFTQTNPLTPNTRVDISYKVFNIPHYFPVHSEGEVVISREDCPAAIRQLQKMVLVERVPLNYIVEIRFVKADDIWLSPNYQRDSCHITLCIYNPSMRNKMHYLYGSFKALSTFKPRFHWGKYFYLEPKETEYLYPKYREFLKIRAQSDPHALFLNGQVASTFGLTYLY